MSIGRQFKSSAGDQRRRFLQEAMIFDAADRVWGELEATYAKDFRGLVYGYFPLPQDILVSLQFLAERINEITWEVRVD